MLISRRKMKHIKRVVEMQTIVKLIDEGTATQKQINRLKKLRMLERGQWAPNGFRGLPTEEKTIATEEK